MKNVILLMGIIMLSLTAKSQKAINEEFKKINNQFEKTFYVTDVEKNEILKTPMKSYCKNDTLINTMALSWYADSLFVIRIEIVNCYIKNKQIGSSLEITDSRSMETAKAINLSYLASSNKENTKFKNIFYSLPKSIDGNLVLLAKEQPIMTMSLQKTREFFIILNNKNNKTEIKVVNKF